MIVDAHCHAWPSWPYDPKVPDATTRGTAPMLDHVLERHGIDHAVVVAANLGASGTPEDDDDAYVARLATSDPDRYTAVADLDSFWSPSYGTPGMSDRLARITDAGPFRGVAHYVRGDDDGHLLSDDALSAWRHAERSRLVVGVHAPPAWHSSVLALAAKLPDLTIVLHHQGLVTDEVALDGLLTLAARPNILLKASGFHHLVDEPWRFPFAPALERFEAIVDAFGPDRLMWGSDYPVCEKHGIGYRQALEAVRTECRFLDAAALDAVLGGTAARVFGLAAAS
ncbi:amidohydrolase family protein [Agromyces sp. H66]|uniref:amidohydrolase family protein n=1 Tax=Agromyces sp. H66 TaxID=2529859 RepID=UPI00145AD967|nr:amidohydrolase family protein [Agromyces sp. H66]